MSDYAVELRGISKIYAGSIKKANNNISLGLRKGEIVCIAGENGAGKTTLMKILNGLEAPTAGEIFINGNAVAIDYPLAARKLGIGMVHQHFMLFPEYTVAENMVMGVEPRKWGLFFDGKQARAEAAKVINTHHFSITPDRLVKDLSVGEMQQVEICRLLHRKADIIILDEPTSVLTEAETAALFKTLKELALAGSSLFLITHKLQEIKQIADRVAVLRRGELVRILDCMRRTKGSETNTLPKQQPQVVDCMRRTEGSETNTLPKQQPQAVDCMRRTGGSETNTLPKQQPQAVDCMRRTGGSETNTLPKQQPQVVDKDEIDEYVISKMMIGSDKVSFSQKRERKNSNLRNSNPVITFNDVTVLRRGQKRPLLDKVSFNVRPGEIVGFAGVGGNGLGVLEAVLGGFLHPSAGKITHNGRDISRLNIRRLRNQGLAYVPANRLKVGSALSATVDENIMIDRRDELSRMGFLDRKKIGNFSAKLIGRYNIEMAAGACSAATLSGGNLQKLILAREIDQFRDYFVFSEPTWGLDIAASGFVWDEIAALREKGAAIVLISTNIDEIIDLADRIMVMYRGSIVAEFNRDDACTSGAGSPDGELKEKIGDCMQGLAS